MAKSKVDDLDLDEDFDDLDEEAEANAPKKKSKAKKATGIGATAVAEKLGANPKTFRAWLRRRVEATPKEEPWSALADREPRSRYSWPKWSDANLRAIMKAWKEDDHTRGGRRKSDDEEE